MKAPVRLVLAAMAALAVFACGGDKRTISTADARAVDPVLPLPQPAYLTAVSGAVQHMDAVRTTEAEPGARLLGSSQLTVAALSHADLQFGERASARINGPAAAVIRDAVGSRGRPIMEIDLERGEVTVRVGPLDPGDVFRIRTARALYLVRGTVFGVTVGEDEVLFVEEGRVAVLPRGLDLPAWEELLTDNDRSIREALAELENQAPVFTANQRVMLDAQAMTASANLVADVERKLQRVAAAAPTDRPSLVEELLAAIRATSTLLPRVAASRGPLTAEQQSKLAAIDAVRLLPVPKDPQNLALLESESAPFLVKFTLRTLPQNSEIYIDGRFVGTSVYRGILRANQSLSIRVTKEGYRERRIEVDRARSEVITIQLERLPPSISAESFLKAIRADDLGTVRTYVAEGGSVDVRTENGIPAVVLASGLEPVLRGQAPDLSYHREILRTIAAAGANLEAGFLIEGATLKILHGAVLAGVAGFDVFELLQVLTSNRADVNGVIVLEGEEVTPLAITVRWALFTGETQEEIIRLLLESGASLDVAIRFNDELLTLREIAAELIDQGELDDPELIRLLRRAG